ncbi:3-deoxy-D-manno-octulosonate 8-phosphate phosphatase, YrbI family [Denitrovibrio acetiphilus DSM 12809]|uniref:3-deoxy-D-manno-octulosonate 8-phosphate phosphatase KdsC n=1 Tax=Denitrovibrio acetiphilus (strain DSM 12809 / NBRC 114555 / N2460) TaxID=522772 RepID=D4H7S8_DENA2|nr:HAD-IIIA family hydrolase [Denitrovibrio acetiphilus]ADD68077.1 3-deoxy-D-manno-octulosonate 8-phosphate phosphatase, YrbI family [Denitrovibrio acetiphilus DSM 12809]
MIKVLMLDVDGVMTDGGIIYDENGHETKRFDVKDGLGIKLAQKHGIEVIIISGRKSVVTDLRTKELGIRRVYTGVKDKLECYSSLKKELRVCDEECAYIGDDLNDISLLKTVGFSATVSDAFDYMKDSVDYVTVKNGGSGAVRELIEVILERNGKWAEIKNSFFS